MYTTIQKWGNSNGLRIPKVFLDALGLSENDRVELTQTADTITIKKVTEVPHRSLEDRLIAFYGKPLEEIGPIESQETDWGKPEGCEVW